MIEADEARLTVRNSGLGPPQGASERIDVGLAIATRIAQAHCGALAVIDGESPGAIAFRLSLPLSAPPPVRSVGQLSRLCSVRMLLP